MENAIDVERKIEADADGMFSTVFGITIVFDSAEFSCLIFMLCIRATAVPKRKMANIQGLSEMKMIFGEVFNSNP